MSPAENTGADLELVTAQIGRPPRGPWRVAARCEEGLPTAIVSPSMLEDGERFPSLAWLTCPWLAEVCASLESSGATSAWALRARTDEVLSEGLRRADAEVRAMRTAESGGIDACSEVGVAGQRDPLGVKCLHAHVALALVGVADPIGSAVLAGLCTERCGARCAALHPDEAVGL